MNKKLLILMASVIVLMIMLTGCGDSETGSDGSSVSLQFPTASTTGTIYPLGSAMANLWHEELGYQVSAQASNGGVHNLNLLKDGEADISFATVGIIWEAYHGERSFEGRQYDDVRIIAGLYYNPNQFVVRAEAGIGSIADIKGKRFAPGASGSTPEVESSIILTEYGLNYPDDIQANFVGFTEAIDLMRNNQIDGALIQAGLPTAAVTEMTSTAGGKLIGIDPEIRASLMEKYPWYSDFVIPAGTYDNQDEDVETLAIKMMLIADASVDEEVIYNLVKTMWENVEKLESAHPIVEQFDINQATTDLAGIPLHPGAEKYYKETGVLTE
ncbi:TRAP transporter TAXI family solute receptor [Caldalkalibacillus uzonensis]|uniref:TRAP transporter TAXI family solute receptor n=1 Tax=Caldalkalibacillus uzonensis TaxID=353224 RepID=A0ABU0CVW9_9BACI|nr:TAXI family TRAP transporter solute-binding subunit [Caldalkalibacillus uzonensis]MDQ0339675.1 TRAP transporter TAXI family solute receptor [Caldalkalibacillus uzonensis]